ncbi:FdhD protein [Paracoccus alkenifer]|uniref:Sulfur carrier protein FdhD n=1 Tax=Paracoccus alkenifer TaxID=65735 RepID=A0A1H6KZ53_9RHOB|nr:FdhD protein [Paracoccus alkenifer]
MTGAGATARRDAVKDNDPSPRGGGRASDAFPPGEATPSPDGRAGATEGAGPGGVVSRAAGPAVPAGPAASASPLRRWSGAGWDLSDAPAPPEEAAVAIVVDGTSQAVLMATPHDLDDLALGFALTEGLIAAPGDVTDAQVVAVAPPAALPGLPALETRLWLRPGLAAGLAERRRSMVGPVGCGLCGVDSIAAALPPVVPVAAGYTAAPADIALAMQALAEGQRRWRDTPAIHAAGFWSPDVALVREDVGRHNALDKLAGALAARGIDPGGGIIAMTSRLSVDLVQKTARIGAGLLVGASTPTRLAIDWAEAAGLTLIGRARAGSFDLYTHPQRIRSA